MKYLAWKMFEETGDIKYYLTYKKYQAKNK